MRLGSTLIHLIIIFLFYGCKKEKGVYKKYFKETLTVCSSGKPSTLDPHFQDDSQSYRVLINIYDTLVSFNPNMSLIPDIAINWEMDQDLLWRFTITNDKFFHNGKRVEAKDVVYSFLRAKNSPNSDISSYLSLVDTIWSEGKTVFIKFIKPIASFMNRLPLIFVAPAGNSFTDELIPPVGSGPFKFVKFTDEGIRLQKINPTNFSFIDIKSVPNNDQRGEMLLSGECDIADKISYSNVYKNIVENINISIKKQMGLITFMMVVDTTQPPFNEVKVRKAVNYLLDREELVEKFVSGFGIPLGQIAPPTVFGHIPEIDPPSKDLEKTKLLLKEAGYNEPIKIRLKSSKTLSLLNYLIAEQLAPFFDVESEIVSWQTLYNQISKGTVGNHISGWLFSSADISDFLESLVHTKDGRYGDLNSSGYSNKKLDSLIELSSTILDIRTRKKVLADIVYTLTDELPYIPLFVRVETVGIRKPFDVILYPNGVVKLETLTIKEK